MPDDESRRYTVAGPLTPVVVLDEIDSTNSEAIRRAVAGTRGPLWIRAERQTGGRGRSGRSWTSPAGNLFASLLIEPDCQPQQVQQLSLAAAVAVVDAIRQASRAAGLGNLVGLRLKWPNDVLVGREKVAGILVESTTVGSRRIVVIGIGVNLASAPGETGRPVTCLSLHGLELSAEALHAMLAAAMAQTYQDWNEGRGFGVLRTRWLDAAGPIGERIMVSGGVEPVEGAFAGIDEDGALLVARADGAQVRYTFGDVTLAGGPKQG